MNQVAEKGDPKDLVSPKEEPVVSVHGAVLRTPSHGAGKLQIGNPASQGRLSKQEVRERVLGFMEGPALERDKAILTGWCTCPFCRKKYEIEPPSDQVSEGAANRMYRYGLGTDDKVQVQDREAVLKAFASLAREEKWPTEEAKRLLSSFADKLGVE